MEKTQGSKLRKNIWRLIIITIAGSLIYGLPYFRSYVYDAYLETYNLTNTQMGTFGSIFGVMGACSYLFGGVVADYVKPRKLMAISLVVSGAIRWIVVISTSFAFFSAVSWASCSILLMRACAS